ncbi:MAG TPA: hypothetical protein VGO58_02955 [Chitinophagaceae bacterium]|jgi:hypothetical protein|nr:hypothetical protein [Chitinophagaceae bacterium]
MTRKLINLLVACACLSFIACGGGKQTPQSIAKKWCNLNARLHQAPAGGPEYGRAKAALNEYENEIDRKYGKDATFMDKVDEEIEKCEDASEGR